MPHDDEKRKAIHATICAPAADLLRAFSVAHGVTLTAFLDGLGHALEDLEHAGMDDLAKCSPALHRAVLAARLIDAERRSREPRLPRPSSNGAPATEDDRPGR